MIYSREYQESIEAKFLAPYAIHSKNSRGRKYPETEPDYRTCFQRDRDRVLHTTAFRRLEYKTQVFINYEGDYYRTRLTHTLEVTQIGRTIARALGASEDLVEVICMAHDMGHPPFGHSGESTLNQLMQNHGGFNHNHHSYRIVTEIERRYPDFPGLNLSWEVLEGMVKHETEYDKTDALEYDPSLRGNLEAQITNVADELAYTSHDLDDGLRSGIITPEMLDGIELWEIASAKHIKNGCLMDDLTRHMIIRDLTGLQVTSMINTSAQVIEKSQVKSARELQLLGYNVVGFDDEMKKRNRILKDFLFKNMYHHYRVVRMQKKAERILTELFNAYANEPSMLPLQFQNLIEEKGKERTICDYLAGMTDRFAVDEYAKLFDPSLLP
ncbi:MAG: deoxyguanosinetriphosphate triphosphohydrolase [Anaerolineae bacterium]|jgi:dGTPase|nr:deoxyguanosinetriphosphate triphosphohydrolase [Anaerolineae bacterium]PKO03120.1 MAG: deoxyguanosinetriphosphate triphosphohydrolase [Chloroflexi bacterium HGW-Chloroflexi-5]